MKADMFVASNSAASAAAAAAAAAALASSTSGMSQDFWPAQLHPALQHQLHQQQLLHQQQQQQQQQQQHQALLLEAAAALNQHYSYAAAAFYPSQPIPLHHPHQQHHADLSRVLLAAQQQQLLAQQQQQQQQQQPEQPTSSTNEDPETSVTSSTKSSTSSAGLKTALLSIIDRLRERKARPDADRICSMMSRQHGLPREAIARTLEQLVEDGAVLRVEYKGSVSYRNASKWRNNNKVEMKTAEIAAKKKRKQQQQQATASSNKDADVKNEDADEKLEEASNSCVLPLDLTIPFAGTVKVEEPQQEADLVKDELKDIAEEDQKPSKEDARIIGTLAAAESGDDRPDSTRDVINDGDAAEPSGGDCSIGSMDEADKMVTSATGEAAAVEDSESEPDDVDQVIDDEGDSIDRERDESDGVDPDASTWSIDEVADWLGSRGFADAAAACRAQEIDGEALLLLRRADILACLGLRLGPAVKFFECVCRLQAACQSR